MRMIEKCLLLPQNTSCNYCIAQIIRVRQMVLPLVFFIGEVFMESGLLSKPQITAKVLISL